MPGRQYRRAAYVSRKFGQDVHDDRSPHHAIPRIVGSGAVIGLAHNAQPRFTDQYRLHGGRAAKDKLSLSLLQARLIDLNAPVKMASGI